MARIRDELYTAVFWFGASSTFIALTTGSLMVESKEYDLAGAFFSIGTLIAVLTGFTLHSLRASKNRVYPRLLA